MTGLRNDANFKAQISVIKLMIQDTSFDIARFGNVRISI